MAKKQVIRLTEGDLHRIIKESVNIVLNSNRTSKKHIKEAWGTYEDEDYEDEYGDYRYVGRTADYYNEDDDSLYSDWGWTYSDDINDKDFVDEVYEITAEDSRELDYWLRCQRMNEYQRNHAFNYRTARPEEMYQYLIKNGKRIK